MCKLWDTVFKNNYACEDCPLYDVREITNCDYWTKPWEVEVVIRKLQKVKKLFEESVDNN